MVTEEKIGVLTQNNDYLEFDVDADGIKIEQRLKIKVADPKEHKCIDILPPNGNDMVYLACFRIKPVEITTKEAVDQEVEQNFEKDPSQIVEEFEKEQNRGTTENEIEEDSSSLKVEGEA